MDLELPTGFEATQHTYQSAAHAILGQDVAGDGLFVELTRIEILYRPSPSLGTGQRSFRIVFGLETTAMIRRWERPQRKSRPALPDGGYDLRDYNERVGRSAKADCQLLTAESS